jgi:hypothetical protein
VKAWCWTGNSTTKTLNPTQDAVDAVNFIDGYNLRLDAVSQTGVGAGITDVYGGFATGPYGALRFAFITPMPDTKYKVFVQFGQNLGTQSFVVPPYSHVLNSSVYPKTTTGFWVRLGFPISAPGPTSNQMIQMQFGPDVWATNIRVIVI